MGFKVEGEELVGPTQKLVGRGGRARTYPNFKVKTGGGGTSGLCP